MSISELKLPHYNLKQACRYLSKQLNENISISGLEELSARYPISCIVSLEKLSSNGGVNNRVLKLRGHTEFCYVIWENLDYISVGGFVEVEPPPEYKGRYAFTLYNCNSTFPVRETLHVVITHKCATIDFIGKIEWRYVPKNNSVGYRDCVETYTTEEPCYMRINYIDRDNDAEMGDIEVCITRTELDVLIQKLKGETAVPVTTIEIEPTAELENTSTELFSPSSNTYPEELAIALKAWQEVSKATPQKGKTPKGWLLDYLNKNHSDLSEEAKKRIAIIANWDKNGGAPPT